MPVTCFWGAQYMRATRGRDGSSCCPVQRPQISKGGPRGSLGWGCLGRGPADSGSSTISVLRPQGAQPGWDWGRAVPSHAPCSPQRPSPQGAGAGRAAPCRAPAPQPQKQVQPLSPGGLYRWCPGGLGSSVPAAAAPARR